jgi:MFS family permease
VEKNIGIDFNICRFNTALFLRAVLLLTPVALLFYQENGLGVQDLFFFQGIFYFVSILLELPVGYLSDNISRKKLLIVSFCVYILGMSLWLFNRSYYSILAGEVMFGASKVMMDNSMSGYLYDYLDKNNSVIKMNKYYGYLQFYLAFGSAIASIIGAYMYAKFGSFSILVSEIFLISVSILLVLPLPNIVPLKRNTDSIIERLNNFKNTTQNICNNQSIINHIFYSGFLSAYSILFALSFQPLMQKSMFPVFMFGVITCVNHGVRAISGMFANTISKVVSIHKMIIPLYVMYISAFMCIFIIMKITNIVLISLMLILICLIIGCQLIFTILHISRIHNMISIEQRGSLMAVNNFTSRIMTTLILLSSNFLIKKFGVQDFYSVVLVLFLIVATCIMIKTYKVKE